MPRVTIAAQSLIGSYPALPLAATAADLMFTATDDPISRSTPIVNAKTVLLALNTDSTPHTVTITSAVDAQGRKGDISTYSVVAGHLAAFGPFQTAGWSTGGILLIDTDSPLLRLAVVQLP